MPGGEAERREVIGGEQVCQPAAPQANDTEVAAVGAIEAAPELVLEDPPSLGLTTRCGFTGTCAAPAMPASRCVEQADSQQIESRTPIHRPLERLEAIDLSLRLPLAPRQREAGFHGSAVGTEAVGEPTHFWQRPLVRLLQPARERCHVVVADECAEGAREGRHERHLGTGLGQVHYIGALLLGERLGLPEQPPRRLPRRVRADRWRRAARIALHPQFAPELQGGVAALRPALPQVRLVPAEHAVSGSRWHPLREPASAPEAADRVAPDLQGRRDLALASASLVQRHDLAIPRLTSLPPRLSRLLLLGRRVG